MPPDLPDRHTLHRHQGHLGWDRDLAPALTVAPGSEVELEIVDAPNWVVSFRFPRAVLE